MLLGLAVWWRHCKRHALFIPGELAFLNIEAAEAPANVKATFGNTVVTIDPDGRSRKIWLAPDGTWTGLSRRGLDLAWTSTHDALTGLFNRRHLGVAGVGVIAGLVGALTAWQDRKSVV